MDDIFNTYKSLIHREIIIEIEKSMASSEYKRVTILKLAINDTTYLMDVAPDDFEQALKKSKVVFHELEEYELCARCVSLIDSMKSRINSLDIRKPTGS